MTHLKYELVHPSAIPPAKAHATDAGYDLAVVDVAKRINDTVTLYRTGVKVVVEPGYYIEVVPRSSIIKSGYMLANSIGVIDSGYRGEIFVALAKIDTKSPPLQLPYKGFQLIIRKQIDATTIEEGSIDESETARGAGGFGSTGP